MIESFILEIYQILFILSCIVILYAIFDLVLFGLSYYLDLNDYEPTIKNNWLIIWLSLGVFISYLI